MPTCINQIEIKTIENISEFPMVEICAAVSLDLRNIRSVNEEGIKDAIRVACADFITGDPRYPEESEAQG